MSKTKWTPGPWHLFNKRGAVAVMANEALRPHNEVVHWTGFDASHFQKQVIPNAMLISAAPDLYSALKKMVEAYWRGSEDSDDEHAPDAVKVALAALAKARGETP